MTKPTIAVVGAGKVGSALSVALHRNGYPITGVASRNLSTAKKLGERLGVCYSDIPAVITPKAKVIFITTPDREITGTVNSIANQAGFCSGQVVAHASGLLPASVMETARRYDASVAAFHPLQSFADVETAITNLPGSYFFLEGDRAALDCLEPVVHDLGGKGFTIKEEDKPLYHAAATVASNYLVAIIHMATEMLGRFGLDKQQSVEALLPLIQGTVNNIKGEGSVKALTGPVERGDTPTIQKHLGVLSQLHTREKQAYISLAQITVAIALQKGSIDKIKADELISILEEDSYD